MAFCVPRGMDQSCPHWDEGLVLCGDRHGPSIFNLFFLYFLISLPFFLLLVAGIEICTWLPSVCVVNRIHILTVKQFWYLYMLQVSQQRQPSLSGVGVTDIDLQLPEEEREAVRTLALIYSTSGSSVPFPSDGSSLSGSSPYSFRKASTSTAKNSSLNCSETLMKLLRSSPAL